MSSKKIEKCNFMTHCDKWFGHKKITPSPEKLYFGGAGGGDEVLFIVKINGSNNFEQMLQLSIESSIVIIEVKRLNLVFCFFISQLFQDWSTLASSIVVWMNWEDITQSLSPVSQQQKPSIELLSSSNLEMSDCYLTEHAMHNSRVFSVLFNNHVTFSPTFSLAAYFRTDWIETNTLFGKGRKICIERLCCVFFFSANS